MARRTHRKTIKRLRVTLASGEVAVRGQRAHANTANGTVYADHGTITTLIPIGYFTEDVTGDGTITTLVDLFEEISLDGWDNDDAPNNVEAADRFTEVYLKDETTVSTLSTNRSAAGRVFEIGEDGRVYLQQGLAVAGPTGASVGASQNSGVADKAALSAIAAASRFDGMLVMVRADGSLWRFDAAGTATEDEGQELVIAPDAGTGRWLAADKHKTLKLPFSFADADGHALLTVPAGFVLRLAGFPFWDITTSFSGGSSSAIGVSTDVTGYTTEGDLLGGATGDVEAALTAGVRAGTLGGELDDHVGFQALALIEGDVIEYDEITSAFTAGAGFVCIPVAISIPA
jgi:hypothetical protein